MSLSVRTEEAAISGINRGWSDCDAEVCGVREKRSRIFMRVNDEVKSCMLEISLDNEVTKDIR